MQKKKILITGAAGFIGSNFVRMLMNETDSKYDLIALDSLTYAGNLENLADFKGKPGYRFVKADICDVSAMNELIQECDFVVNFAAESHVDRSIMGSEPFVKTNIEGTRVLLDACKQHGIDRYHQVSTDEVYGTLGKTGFFTETTPLAPNSPYSASKAGADLLVRAYNETFDFPATITRCSNNYGCWHFPEKLIPLFVTNLIDDKKVPVYGDGMQVRDWLHVTDHCKAILSVIENAADGAVYNVGGNNEQYNIDITKMILKHLNKDDSYIEHVTDRLGHDRRYAIDASKIKNDLGWEPTVDFKQGLTETIEWYINNENWWRKIKSGEYMEFYQQYYGNR